MVRAIVGTLLEVGKKTNHVGMNSNLLSKKKNRCAAGASAPAEGLFLSNIDYPAY